MAGVESIREDPRQGLRWEPGHQEAQGLVPEAGGNGEEHPEVTAKVRASLRSTETTGRLLPPLYSDLAASVLVGAAHAHAESTPLSAAACQSSGPHRA